MRGTLSRSQTLMILATAVFSCFSSAEQAWRRPAQPASECVTIMHTNDMHSKFVASPNADYTPGSTGDDSTIGGIARIATKVGEVRDDMGSQGIPVLLLDGGDFTMGTLFHLLRGEAEMGMMNYLGYDAVTLGNHEFDLLPTGAANIVSYRDGIRVLATNLEVQDDLDPWGAAIQASHRFGGHSSVDHRQDPVERYQGGLFRHHGRSSLEGCEQALRGRGVSSRDAKTGSPLPKRLLPTCVTPKRSISSSACPTPA